MSAGLLSIAVSSAAWADTVRLHGSTTVVDVVINPHRVAVQQATGHALEIVGTTTGKGLVNLVEGRADASLCSEPLDIAIEAAAAAGAKIDPAKLTVHELRKDEILFVVHPSNPVTSLTWKQIGDIHTGKITNWKEVGGKDMPITVYADALGGGTRNMVKKIVMGDVDYGLSTRTLSAVKRVAGLVAKDPAGIGAVGRGFVDPSKDKVVQTQKLERPLSIITLGDPSPKVQQVIDAFRARVAKTSS